MLPDMLAEGVIARARAIRAETRATREHVQRTRARIAVQVQASAFLRVFHLARGASDEPIETRTRQCPHCWSDAVKSTGQIQVAGDVMKVNYRCDGCGKPFLFLRRPVDYGRPGSAGSPTSS